MQDELAVNYCHVAVVSTDPPEVTAAFRAGLGATFTFLSDHERRAVNELDIVEQTAPGFAHGLVAKPYSVESVELDPPKRGEVLIKVGAAGVCRSDLHFQKGEATIALPAVLGHEGAGTVERVGEGVSMVKPGDRVILSFVPNCGHCHSCESGRPHLCDEHARTSGKLYDNTSRLHTQAGQDCAHMGKVACFAEYAVVPETGCV